MIKNIRKEKHLSYKSTNFKNIILKTWYLPLQSGTPSIYFTNLGNFLTFTVFQSKWSISFFFNVNNKLMNKVMRPSYGICSYINLTKGRTEIQCSEYIKHNNNFCVHNMLMYRNPIKLFVQYHRNIHFGGREINILAIFYYWTILPLIHYKALYSTPSKNSSLFTSWNYISNFLIRIIF